MIEPIKAITFYNPYIAGPPITNPKLFFGRQADLEKVIDLLKNNFVMLVGSRRIGKTSMLHQLLYHLPRLTDTVEQFLPVLVSAEGTAEAEFFHAIMEEVVEATQKHLPGISAHLSFDLSNPSYASRTFSRDLQVILKNLQETLPKPVRLALLLDEMDTLNGFGLETQAQLRRIFQRFTHQNLSVVVAGVKLHQHWAGENAQWSELDPRWQGVDLPENGPTIGQALRRVAAHARQHRCHLLLLCDEIEGLNQLGQHEPRVLSELRRVMQHNPAIRPVLASTRRLSRLYAIQQQQDTSLFLEGFEPRYLTNFDDDTANQVICCAQSNDPLTVDSALQAQIRFFCGNHPLILQKVCQQLFDSKRGMLRSFAENEFILDDQLSGTFQQDFDALTPDEAKVLLFVNAQAVPIERIEQAFPHLSQSGLRRMLHDLSQLGFLRRLDSLFQAGSIPLGEWLAAGPSHHTPQGGVTDHLMRKMSQEQKASLHRQLITHFKALNYLREQAAKFGISAPTHIQLDIDGHVTAIHNIETELTELGENMTPFQPFQPE